MMLVRNVHSFNDHLDVFDDLFGLWGGSQHLSSDRYNVLEDQDTLTLSIDLPGVKRSDLVVEVHGSTLHVKSERDGKKHSRRYSVNKQYDAKTASAVLTDGVLTVKFDKVKPKETNVINVEVK